VDSKDTRRIWQSSPPHYEYTSSILSDLDTPRPVSLGSLRVLARRESVTEPPQFYIKSFSAGGEQHSERRISNFPHPYPSLKDLQKEIIKYKRSDGLELNGTLYLPAGKGWFTHGGGRGSCGGGWWRWLRSSLLPACLPACVSPFWCHNHSPQA
jgi:dipeptidyl aminopeptidase/acylaminoacyl peptidase